jgi:drug/metabolite transporter (DMT)-like permease
VESGSHASYYATAAQIIPVLFLAASGVALFRREQDRPVSSVLLLVMTASVVVGEAVALTALFTGSDPPSTARGSIVLALAIPLLVVAIAVAEPHAPAWLRRTVRTGAAMIAGSVLAVLVVFQPDLSGVWSASLVIASAFVLGAFTLVVVCSDELLLRYKQQRSQDNGHR